MAVKEIVFKCTKASTYYTIGGVRIYDSNGNIYPIKFPSKNSLTSSIFYIQGTDITGTVSTANSYSTYYYVDSPFDIDKSIVTNYPSANYWLSSSADTIKISFDKDIAISRIDFVPYCGNGANRKQNAVEITAVDNESNILLQEKYNTSSFVENQVYSALTPILSFSNNILLTSNNKTYSLKSIDTWYETKMTSNIAPSPLVVSASNYYTAPYLAFDASKTSLYSTASRSDDNAWIQIDFGKNKRVNMLSFTAGSGSVDYIFTPKRFQILASFDGLTFVNIFEVSNLSWINGETKKFTFPNTTPYRFYRIFCPDGTPSGSDGIFRVAELLYGYRGLYMNALPSYSIKNFIDYSQKTIPDLDSQIFNKNYILQDEVSENSEGLWTTKLDRKPLSISFN